MKEVYEKYKGYKVRFDHREGIICGYLDHVFLIMAVQRGERHGFQLHRIHGQHYFIDRDSELGYYLVTKANIYGKPDFKYGK